jgi:hypothetical protein
MDEQDVPNAENFTIDSPPLTTNHAKPHPTPCGKSQNLSGQVFQTQVPDIEQKQAPWETGKQMESFPSLKLAGVACMTGRVCKARCCGGNVEGNREERPAQINQRSCGTV